MAARGRPAPALVVVKAPDIRSAAARQGIAALAGWHSPAIGQPVEVTVYPAANLAEIEIPLAGTGTDAVSQHALTTLHNTIVPATVGRSPAARHSSAATSRKTTTSTTSCNTASCRSSCSSWASRSSS